MEMIWKLNIYLTKVFTVNNTSYNLDKFRNYIESFWQNVTINNYVFQLI